MSGWVCRGGRGDIYALGVRTTWRRGQLCVTTFVVCHVVTSSTNVSKFYDVIKYVQCALSTHIDKNVLNVDTLFVAS